MSEGTEAMQKYFSQLKGSGNKNAIQERRTIAIDDNAALVTGFYEFTRMQEGKAVPAPSRFTMLITKRGGEWRIAHHHSSPQFSQTVRFLLPQPQQIAKRRTTGICAFRLPTSDVRSPVTPRRRPPPTDCRARK